jgi:NADH/NAD ratio-sensing transcriptional regulator Rex
MEYNTQLKKLSLPEYGRNIQNMVDFCLTILDRDERKRCANTIISIMGNLFPHLRDVNDFKHILWDHLAIMSDFKLDIDYPYEIVKKEDLFSKPGKIEYSRPDMEYRHYGKTLEKMAKLAISIQDQKEKEQFVLLVATHMKKSYIQWNKEVDDQKIFIDLYDLSEGKIDIRNSDIRLPEMRDLGQRNNNHNNGKKNGQQKKK